MIIAGVKKASLDYFPFFTSFEENSEDIANEMQLKNNCSAIAKQLKNNCKTSTKENKIKETKIKEKKQK